MQNTKARKPKKTFADIAAGRRTYNPDVEGYGNPREWRGQFSERMGFKEATETVNQAGQGTPRFILGVGLDATWDQIKSAFRKKFMDCHPDRIVINKMSLEEATAKSKILNAAFSLLSLEFGK
jgi:hypothetical protein